MTTSDLLVNPQFVNVRFALDPVLSAVDMIAELVRVGNGNRHNEWAISTAAQLTPHELRMQQLLFEVPAKFFYHHSDRDFPTFPDYLDDLVAQGPMPIHNQTMAMFVEKVGEGAGITPEMLLADRNLFFDVVRQHWEGEVFNEELFSELHRLLNAPAELLSVLVGHLRHMWETYIRAEWERQLPALQAAVEAYRRIDFGPITAIEALREVTGREVPPIWASRFEGVKEMVFAPTSHLGPYMVVAGIDERRTILFGVRMPKEIRAESNLSRVELLVRLNALADDTRLRILEMIGRNGEMKAADIATQLGLTQPTTSRHLIQLVSSGFLVERRQDVAKVYSLNRERVQSTLSGLERLLTSAKG